MSDQNKDFRGSSAATAQHYCDEVAGHTRSLKRHKLVKSFNNGIYHFLPSYVFSMFFMFVMAVVLKHKSPDEAISSQGIFFMPYAIGGVVCAFILLWQSSPRNFWIPNIISAGRYKLFFVSLLLVEGTDISQIDSMAIFMVVVMCSALGMGMNDAKNLLVCLNHSTDLFGQHRQAKNGHRICNGEG